MIKAIAVIVVMVAVNAFMVFAIVKASGKLDDSLRRYFVSKVGAIESSNVITREKVDTIFGGEAQNFSGDSGKGAGAAQADLKTDYFDPYGNLNPQYYSDQPGETPYSGYGGQTPNKKEDKKKKTETDYSSLYSFFGMKGPVLNFNPDVMNRGPRVKIVRTKAVGAIPIAEDSNAARYKNAHLRDDYRTMKQLSLLDKQSAVNVVRMAQTEEGAEKAQAVKGINAMLDFDTAFAMSSLDGEDQKKLLAESFDAAQQAVLADYLAQSGKNFSAVDFYGYMQGLKALADDSYYVYTGAGADSLRSFGDGTKTVLDTDIAEGVKIVYKDRLYDYSI